MHSKTFSPGPIVLMGSGETSPSSGAAFEEVAKCYPKPLRIAILETPAGFELNSPKVAGRVGEFLQNRLQNYHPYIDIIPARRKGTEFSPDNETILEPLYSANMIFMGPGSPTYATKQLSGSLAYDIIQARHRTGAALVLASAATIAIGCQALPVYEIYKAGMDLHWQPGLNFLHRFGLDVIIVPHWNNAEGGMELDTSHCFMGEKRFSELLELNLCHGTVIGIDEHTSLWIDISSNTIKVFGKGVVHIKNKGIEKELPSGTSESLDILGLFKIPTNWQDDIRPDVWKRLENYEYTENPSPSDDVSELVERREIARKAGHFDVADRLRLEVENLGWRILDTPDGSKLSKI